jgi:hypothetical protein
MAIAGGGAARRAGGGAGLNHGAGRATKSRAAAGSIAAKNAAKDAAKDAATRMKAFTRQVSGALAALSRRG